MRQFIKKLLSETVLLKESGIRDINDIAKRYNETLITQSWTYDGSTVSYSLSKTPAMSPVEKLEVKVNNNILQFEYDYTLSGNIFTIKTDSIELVTGDIISSKIKI